MDQSLQAKESLVSSVLLGIKLCVCVCVCVCVVSMEGLCLGEAVGWVGKQESESGWS